MVDVVNGRVRRVMNAGVENTIAKSTARAAVSIVAARTGFVDGREGFNGALVLGTVFDFGLVGWGRGLERLVEAVGSLTGKGDCDGCWCRC